jgi:uncharacterized protein YyaL (SSP411 family)
VNAGMIRNYAEAALVFGSKEYKKITRKSVHYVEQNLYDPASGAFFGNQDADEAYYKNRDRKGMAAPAVDRTMYADSSALMISALVSAYGAVGEQQYLDMAMKGADHMMVNLFVKDAGVYHFFRNGERHLDGFLSDNALAGSALLDLYGATGEKRYLHAAKEIERFIVSRFYDSDAKRFRLTLAAPIAVPIAPGVLSKVNDDLANYRALRFIGRVLYYDEGLREHKKVRDDALAASSGTYRNFTPNAAAYGNALLWAVGDPVRITVIAEEEDVRSYLTAIRDVYVPKKTVTVLSIAEDGDLIKKLRYPKQEAVYLCAGKHCSQPITKPGKLKEELKRFLEQKGKK